MGSYFAHLPLLPSYQPATLWVYYTTSCNTQSSAPEDGQNNCPKHVELTGIVNKLLLLHLVGYLYYLYQWCTVKQISDNEIYLLIKYIKSFLWRVAKGLSYTEDARCLKVKSHTFYSLDEFFIFKKWKIIVCEILIIFCIIIIHYFLHIYMFMTYSTSYCPFGRLLDPWYVCMYVL